MKQYLRDLRDGDLEYLEEHLREIDKIEVTFTSGSVKEALEQSVALSYFVKVMCVNDKPVGICGLSEYDDLRDGVWMLGTDELLKHSRKFLRYSKQMVHDMFDQTDKPLLVNFVYEHNLVHQRWLKWIGAEIQPMSFDINGGSFMPFFISREEYV